MDKYYIGIDLGGTNIKGSIFNEGLNVIYEQRLSTALLGDATGMIGAAIYAKQKLEHNV